MLTPEDKNAIDCKLQNLEKVVQDYVELKQEVDKLEHEREFEEAILFSNAVGAACEYRLETEFTAWFIRGIRAGKSVQEAIRIAAGEWDIDLDILNKLESTDDAGICDAGK